MYRYMLGFAKQGLIKYISHLDSQRLFKRAFRRVGIPLSYSQGYNPHPHISFALPLSLGYTSKEEIVEFRTTSPISTIEMLRNVSRNMPKGLDCLFLDPLEIEAKSLASIVSGADYDISFSLKEDMNFSDMHRKTEEFLNLPSIKVEKKKKKKRGKISEIEVEIRDKIRKLNINRDRHDIVHINAELDAGSRSYLSPELVIAAWINFVHTDLKREDIEVCRNFLIFQPCIPQSLGLHLDTRMRD